MSCKVNVVYFSCVCLGMLADHFMLIMALTGNDMLFLGVRQAVFSQGRSGPSLKSHISLIVGSLLPTKISNVACSFHSVHL